MKLLAIAFLLMFQGPIGPQPKTCCGKTEADFPAPAAPTCPAGTAPIPGCISACQTAYSQEMLEIAEASCLAVEAANTAYNIRYQNCLNTYSSDLVYCANTYGNNSQQFVACSQSALDAFNVCKQQAQQQLRTTLNGINSQNITSITALVQYYITCVSHCCQ